MKLIKTIIFALLLCLFIGLVVISLLLPDKVYHQISDSLFQTNHQAPTKLTQNPKPNRPVSSVSPPQTEKKATEYKQAKPTMSNEPVEVVQGFDWRLPNYAHRSSLSGLISESRGDDDYIRADFHMVRWDKTNPNPNEYNFRELENKLRSRSHQQVLLRLETYGKCETPQWALAKIGATARGSLIFWKENYINTLKPYIKEVAKLVKRHPQIIGVQIGISDGQYRGDCNRFELKDGWGEFNLKPDELNDAQNQYGLTPAILESSTKRIIDVYANAFRGITSKLVFNNFDMFSWQDIAIPYNAKMPSIANYALSKGIGNRDGQIEHWMRYTQKIYGMQLQTSSNSTCSLHMDEKAAKRYANRYWGTENEEFGDYYWVRDTYGAVENQAHRFFASSLRALQMRRNYMTVHGEAMTRATDRTYKTQDFLRYLDKTLGKQINDTPDAFILLGERYIANFRLTEFPQHQHCQANGGAAVRSFGRWITERSDSKPSMRLEFPENDQRWGQGFYLPGNLNYEYAARSGTAFNFDLNDELTKTRCSSGCNIEVKVSYKDDNRGAIWIETPNRKSKTLNTSADGLIKTATFRLASQLSGNDAGQDLVVKSSGGPLSLILLRINFLNP